MRIFVAFPWKMFSQSQNIIIMTVVRYTLLIKKVNCTLVRALRLSTDRTAHRGSRGIALLWLDHGTRRGWVVRITTRPHFTPGQDPVPIVQEVGWASGPVWTVSENLAPTGIRPRTVHPVASRICRLRYPIHMLLIAPHKFMLVRLKKENYFLNTLFQIVSILCVCVDYYEKMHCVTFLAINVALTRTWLVKRSQAGCYSVIERCL